MLHSMKEARCVLIPEMPAGVTDMGKMKPLCEQLGVKVASRTHCKDPERTNPRYELVGFSNHNMDIGENPDSGEARRVNIFRFNRRFGSDTEDDGEDKPELKELIATGAWNLQIFHMSKPLYTALSLYSTNIRRPTRIERETMEVVGTALDNDATRLWITSVFEPCTTAQAPDTRAR